MKTSFLTALSLLIFQIISAQQNDKRLKNYFHAEVALEDGQTLNGYVKEIKTRSTENPFLSIEQVFGLAVKKIEFKKDAESKETDYEIDRIKSISILDEDSDEVGRYDKARLFTIDSKMKLKDLKTTALLPLYSEGKINLYGYFLGSCPNRNSSPEKCTYSMFVAYLKKPDENIAYVPFDINHINIFRLGKIEDQFHAAFLEATKDCPEFQGYYNSKYAHLSRDEKKQMKKEMIEEKKEKMRGLKNIENRKARRYMRLSENQKLMVKQYLEILGSYSEMCP